MRLAAPLVFAPDLDEAQRFYENNLGLKLVVASGTMLSFDLGVTKLHVFKCARAARDHEHGADASTVIAFEVTSVEKTMVELRAKGVSFLHERAAFNPTTRMRYAAFRAPGGLVHELVESV